MNRVVALVVMVLICCALVACDSQSPSTTSPSPLIEAPVISQFSADATNPRLLVWTVTGERLQIRIDPLVGNVQPVGAQNVPPDTYTITASNDGGVVKRSCIVR